MSNAGLTLVALLLFAAAPALGQGGAAPAAGARPEELAEAERLSAAAVRLINEGKLEEALTPARRALELREKAAGPSHWLVSVALNNLAALQLRRGQHGEADALFKRSLEIAEKNPGADRGHLSETLMQYAWLRYARGEYSRAEELLARAVREREEALGGEHPGLARALFQLARFHAARGEGKEARRLYSRAVALVSKQPPAKDLSSARELRNYVCLLAGGAGKGEDTFGDVAKLIRRLEDPDKALKLEKQAQAAAAGGDDTEDSVVSGRAVSKAQPRYPEEALRSRVTGAVVVEITVDESGRVAKSEAFCGHPLLRKASEEAVAKWRFTPTTLSGEPVKVTGFVTVKYALR